MYKYLEDFYSITNNNNKKLFSNSEFIIFLFILFKYYGSISTQSLYGK